MLLAAEFPGWGAEKKKKKAEKLPTKKKYSERIYPTKLNILGMKMPALKSVWGEMK